MAQVIKDEHLRPAPQPLSRPKVPHLLPEARTAEIPVTELEQAQYMYLRELGMFHSFSVPVIRNVHYECSGTIFGSSYDNTIRYIASVVGPDHPREPEAGVLDIYLDTPEHTLMLNMHIFLRVRLLINGHRFAAKVIAGLKDGINRPHVFEDIPFKYETVYLTEVSEDAGESRGGIIRYLESLREVFRTLQVVGVIYKRKTHFTLFPWAYAGSGYVDLTMAGEWVNMHVEQVSKYQHTPCSFADFLSDLQMESEKRIELLLRNRQSIISYMFGSSRDEIRMEIEASHHSFSLSFASDLVKKLSFSDSTLQFEHTPKSSFFIN